MKILQKIAFLLLTSLACSTMHAGKNNYDYKPDRRQQQQQARHYEQHIKRTSAAQSDRFARRHPGKHASNSPSIRQKVLCIAFIFMLLFGSVVAGTDGCQDAAYLTSIRITKKPTGSCMSGALNYLRHYFQGSPIFDPYYVLLNSLKDYHIINNASSHAGDLYAHTIWATRQTIQWCDNENGLVYIDCEGFNTEDKDLIILAALLHDIGKGGDLQFEYGDGVPKVGNKDGHPAKSCDYLLQKIPYYLAENEIFDFTKAFEDLGITEEKQAFIITVVAAHHEFGDGLLTSISRGQDVTAAYETFLNNLARHAEKTGYNNGIPTEELIRALVLMGGVDLKAKLPVEGTEIDPDCCKPVRKGKDSFVTYNYQENAVKHRDGILEYLYETWLPNHT